MAIRGRKSQLMLTAAMWRRASFSDIESSRNHPGITVAAPHRVLVSPHRKLQFARDAGRMRADRWGMGVSMRKIWYGSVRCVPPVIALLGPGVVFGDYRLPG